MKKTDVSVPLDVSFLYRCLRWYMFFSGIQAFRTRKIFSKSQIRIAFYPDIPRPWYLIWPTLALAGIRFEKNPEKADYIMHFKDTTCSYDTPPFLKSADQLLNFGCQDISKSQVAHLQEDIFSYPLALDPHTHQGEAVEKSDKNGVHDGRIITCPHNVKPGYVYQHVIDNIDDEGYVIDYRCSVVKGYIPLVFVKRRPVSQRFTNSNSFVVLHKPEDIFSQSEQEKLRRFAETMGVDWGALDVLRSRSSGRLYVVDVNTTDIGPPYNLPLVKQWRAALHLAHALKEHLSEKEKLQDTRV